MGEFSSQRASSPQLEPEELPCLGEACCAIPFRTSASYVTMPWISSPWMTGAVEIPKLASFVLKHDFDAEIQGLLDFTPDIPPVAPVFFAFRIMVGMGVLMLAAECGSSIRIEADGADADEALGALVDLVARGFEED